MEPDSEPIPDDAAAMLASARATSSDYAGSSAEQTDWQRLYLIEKHMRILWQIKSKATDQAIDSLPDKQQVSIIKAAAEQKVNATI